MYTISYTNKFDKDVKRCVKRGLDIAKLQEAARILAAEGSLPMRYRPHKLSANYAGCWECHIEPNWLMVWQQNDTELTLLFMRTGTHSDLL
ncbi:MAG: type II toxin-antitoxin system YafQ family toxin [Paludibacteraceae bacterium]|nr:type II toxin-antitoxin system YafQ family toxin [Paludibacteraceae bacterium]